MGLAYPIVYFQESLPNIIQAKRHDSFEMKVILTAHLSSKHLIRIWLEFTAS